MDTNLWQISRNMYIIFIYIYRLSFIYIEYNDLEVEKIRIYNKFVILIIKFSALKMDL